MAGESAAGVSTRTVWLTAWRTAWRTAVLVAAFAGLGLGWNAVRGKGSLPVVASQGFYENRIFVPCPEVLVEPAGVTATKVLGWSPDSILVVDARPKEEFEAGHHEGAASFPYSVLFSPGKDEVEALARKAGDRIVIACGDTEIGSGKLLAADLMTAGLKQVYFVEGGCVALEEGGK